MNRIQFFVLTGLSSLVLLLLVGDIFLGQQAGFEQNRVAAAQQFINRGQTAQTMVKQLAMRIYQDSQKTQDQALKDLLARQQISNNSKPESTDGTESTAAPAPSTPPSTH